MKEMDKQLALQEMLEAMRQQDEEEEMAINAKAEEITEEMDAQTKVRMESLIAAAVCTVAGRRAHGKSRVFPIPFVTTCNCDRNLALKFWTVFSNAPFIDVESGGWPVHRTCPIRHEV
jgi:hypothetical protein